MQLSPQLLVQSQLQLLLTVEHDLPDGRTAATLVTFDASAAAADGGSSGGSSDRSGAIDSTGVAASAAAAYEVALDVSEHIAETKGDVMRVDVPWFARLLGSAICTVRCDASVVVSAGPFPRLGWHRFSLARAAGSALVAGDGDSAAAGAAGAAAGMAFASPRPAGDGLLMMRGNGGSPRLQQTVRAAAAAGLNAGLGIGIGMEGAHRSPTLRALTIQSAMQSPDQAAVLAAQAQAQLQLQLQAQLMSQGAMQPSGTDAAAVHVRFGGVSSVLPSAAGGRQHIGSTYASSVGSAASVDGGASMGGSRSVDMLHMQPLQPMQPLGATQRALAFAAVAVAAAAESRENSSGAGSSARGASAAAGASLPAAGSGSVVAPASQAGTTFVGERRQVLAREEWMSPGSASAAVATGLAASPLRDSVQLQDSLSVQLQDSASALGRHADAAALPPAQPPFMLVPALSSEATAGESPRVAAGTALLTSPQQRLQAGAGATPSATSSAPHPVMVSHQFASPGVSAAQLLQRGASGSAAEDPSVQSHAKSTGQSPMEYGIGGASNARDHLDDARVHVTQASDDSDPPGRWRGAAGRAADVSPLAYVVDLRRDGRHDDGTGQPSMLSDGQFSGRVSLQQANGAAAAVSSAPGSGGMSGFDSSGAYSSGRDAASGGDNGASTGDAASGMTGLSALAGAGGGMFDLTRVPRALLTTTSTGRGAFGASASVGPHDAAAADDGRYRDGISVAAPADPLSPPASASTAAAFAGYNAPFTPALPAAVLRGDAALRTTAGPGYSSSRGDGRADDGTASGGGGRYAHAVAMLSPPLVRGMSMGAAMMTMTGSMTMTGGGTAAGGAGMMAFGSPALQLCTPGGFRVGAVGAEAEAGLGPQGNFSDGSNAGHSGWADSASHRHLLQGSAGSGAFAASTGATGLYAPAGPVGAGATGSGNVSVSVTGGGSGAYHPALGSVSEASAPAAPTTGSDDGEAGPAAAGSGFQAADTMSVAGSATASIPVAHGAPVQLQAAPRSWAHRHAASSFEVTAADQGPVAGAPAAAGVPLSPSAPTVDSGTVGSATAASAPRSSGTVLVHEEVAELGSSPA